MAHETKILATLGTVTVNAPIKVRDMYGSDAYMEQTIRITPGQTCPIEFVQGYNGDRYIRIAFAGVIVSCFDSSREGQATVYTWFDRSTWTLASVIEAGAWRGRTIALSPEYAIAQHEDESGPAMYSADCGKADPRMLRIVCAANKAPIGWSKAYYSRESPNANGIWFESFL